MGYLLSSPTAHRLFETVKELPIVDYHCHLSPKEIWEDEPFSDIGQLCTIAENGALGTFSGMLTDSRSFLSYARHEYFRRILCDLVGGWVEAGEYDMQAAEVLVRRLCYENTKTLRGDAL